MSELKLFTYLYQYSSNGYFHAPSFPQACQVELPKDQSLVLFSFLFTSTPLMSSSHLMAFNVKHMSTASKFASPAKDLNSKLHAFIPNCLFKSPFISKKKKKSQTQCVQNRTLVCHSENFLNTQLFHLSWCKIISVAYTTILELSLTPSFMSHPTLISLKILFILHLKPILKCRGFFTISIVSSLGDYHYLLPGYSNSVLHQLLQATVTNYHKYGGLEQQFILL